MPIFHFLSAITSARLWQGAFRVPFSSHDSDALRVLKRALFEAFATINDWAPRILTSSEKAYFRSSVAGNLSDAYDAGERDPRALNLAALQGLFVSPLER
jgi:hypothetical protein